MNAEVLMLDVGYQPVATIDWQRAITLIFEGKAEIVDRYPDRVVRSVTLEYELPAVIRFLQKIRRPKRVPKFSRENIYIRDGGRCQYCGLAVHRTELTYDHVLPRSMGGKTTWTNIVACCYPCNQKKGGRTPEQAKMRLLSKPTQMSRNPEAYKFVLPWQEGMPQSWRAWLRDAAVSQTYWHGELDQD